MCKIRTLRTLVNQRLSTAVEEVFLLLETTIAEYEREIERQRRLLELMARPEGQVNKSDVTQLKVIKQEVPPEQHEWRTSLDQKDSEPPHIKEEKEELWSIHEGEQHQGPEGVDFTKIPFTTVPVKSEDDEDAAQSSQVHQRQNEVIGEAAPPASSPAKQTGPNSSDSETDNSDGEWRETRERQQGSTFVKDKAVQIIVEKCNCSVGKKIYKCSECGRKFSLKGSLQRHILSHTGEKPFSCSVCGKKFRRKQHLQEHVIIHTGEQPHGCSVCGKRFRYKAGMRRHMRRHTESDHNSPVCETMFNHSEALPSRMTLHGDDHTVGCSVCEK